MSKPEIIALYRPMRIAVDTNFRNAGWQPAPLLPIRYNWRGDLAPPELSTAARVIWNEDWLYFGFECGYTELDLDAEFDLTQERHALWDRDVCEAFVRSPREPEEKVYKEFEVAPTGQWCDLKVDRTRMQHDWAWRSGMRTAAEIIESANIWQAVMAIPFEAFGARPERGERWQANLFRISRLKGERHFLALSPTLTPSPNFHVPESFIDLIFAV